MWHLKGITCTYNELYHYEDFNVMTARVNYNELIAANIIYRAMPISAPGCRNGVGRMISAELYFPHRNKVLIKNAKISQLEEYITNNIK